MKREKKKKLSPKVVSNDCSNITTLDLDGFQWLSYQVCLYMGLSIENGYHMASFTQNETYVMQYKVREFNLHINVYLLFFFMC